MRADKKANIIVCLQHFLEFKILEDCKEEDFTEEGIFWIHCWMWLYLEQPLIVGKTSWPWVLYSDLKPSSDTIWCTEQRHTCPQWGGIVVKDSADQQNVNNDKPAVLLLNNHRLSSCWPPTELNLESRVTFNAWLMVCRVLLCSRSGFKAAHLMLC